MSQARVTDFFAQRKKGIAEAAKQRHRVPGATTRSRLSQNKDALLGSSVHEEFVRVIDEAAGLNHGQARCDAAEEASSSPRTPKRTSANAEFDLGASAFSATAEHSTAKKSRQGEAARDAPEKVTRRTARKKLVLQGASEDAAPSPPVCGQDFENQDRVTSKNSGGQADKSLPKDDIAALKSRLQWIKKHTGEITSSASPSTAASSQASKELTTSVPKAPLPHTHDARAVKWALAKAKDLAAKAQKRYKEREAEESRPSETQAQDSAELPAYQRYHTLAQSTPPGLSLPYHYMVLAEMFRSMDTVVAMLYNRSEIATFSKVKQGVQDMMHKRFGEDHMGQIQTVFPEAYTFRQEKSIPTFNGSFKKGSYQLTVEPDIVSEQSTARPVLSASLLLKRRRIFHQNLVSHVKFHHKVFLSSLVPPVSVSDDKLTRWHPRFNVDSVPAIQTSPLPQPPHTEKLATAQEVLDKARSRITPKMEDALVSLALKTDSKPASPPQNSAPSAGLAPQVPSTLKGVSQSLLERVRVKEAQKLQVAMTRNSAQEERLLMMSRLGELARILRNVFVAEKKPALIMEVACNRMVASYKSALSTGEMEKHIFLLAEVASEWLTIHPIRKDFYLKLNKNMELTGILDKLSRRLQEEESL
ncbi:DNA replication factor Cdt1 [Betta splendens]|uniref:DNA replication factor Cdt1 n=1 Tax=Betta splendens TaxID=158456 RepID=A0A6P7PYP3_BETSP|nr:DNA replication factor Cdt1 [Betta splendens]